MKKTNLIIFPLLLVLYEIATYLTNDAYLPALPNIVSDLATTNSLAQLTLTAWFLGSASVQLILGPISDYYGRRPVLLIGGIVFVISTAVCALTTNINILLLFRFFQGTTITSMIVAGYATIHELFEHDKAIHTLAWMLSITVLAPAFGPLFGASILHIANWHWIFGILGIWGGIVLLALFFKMPETNKEIKKHPINILRILQQYKAILLNSNYMRSSLSFCFLFGIIIAWLTAGPFLVITKFHRTTFEFGLLQAFVFGSYIIGTRLVKPMIKKYKTTKLLKISLLIVLIGSLLSLLTWVYPDNLSLIVIPLIIIAGATGFSSPILNRTAIESSAEPMGARMAVYANLMSIFGVIGSALIGTIYNGTLFSLACILITFSIISFLLKGFDRNHCQ